MLDDLLILELASVLAGPSVGQFFAELGATVLKIENPRTDGDVTRRWRAPGSEDSEVDDDRSAYFCCCNHGKQSIALDLSTGTGQGLLHNLVQDADVVLASYRPGTAAALGADYETLSSVNPNLLYGHVTGYGPDRERAGYDAIIQAESGFMHMNGPADGAPTKLPVALCDVLGRPDLASHPNLVTNAKRVEHREALTRVLEARFADYETEPLLDALHERNIPTGIVNDVPAVFDQPTAQKMTTDPENGPSGLRQTAFPHPDGTAPPLAPPPHCAEHTTAILRDHLGFSQERIESLAKNEILVR